MRSQRTHKGEFGALTRNDPHATWENDCGRCRSASRSSPQPARTRRTTSRSAAERRRRPTSTDAGRRPRQRHGVGGRRARRRRPPRARRRTTGRRRRRIEMPIPETLPAPEVEPVMGGRLVVAGEAEVGAPVDAGQRAVRLVLPDAHPDVHRAAVVVDDNLEVQAVPRPRASSPTRTPRCGRSRSARASRSPTARRSTPTPPSTTSTAASTACSSAAPSRTSPRTPTGPLVTEKLDDYTFTHRDGQERRHQPAGLVAAVPVLPHRSAGFMASPTWLAAVDGDPSLATQPVGTGPFIVQEYLPGDRMTVDQEPRLLAPGRGGQPAAVPRRDRVPRHRRLPGPRQQALEVRRRRPDRHRPTPASSARYVENSDDFVDAAAERARPRPNYIMFHLTQPQFQSQEVRCALVQAIDKQDFVDVDLRRVPRAGQRPVHARARTATSRTTGCPSTTRRRPRRRSRPGRPTNGPLTINYSTTPTGTTKAAADYLQQSVGRDRRRRDADRRSSSRC